MTRKFICTLLLLLACCFWPATAIEIYDGHSIQPETGKSNSKNDGATTYCPWIYMNVGKGPYDFGLLVNSTLMTISPQVAYTKFNYQCPFKIAGMLMNAIPRHPLIINDPLMMFAHTSNRGQLESDTFMIINGTKWPILGGLNQTYSMGVNE